MKRWLNHPSQSLGHACGWVERITSTRYVKITLACGFAALFAAAAVGSTKDKPELPKYQIDGKVQDWKGIEPVWKDAGRKKPVFPQEFDVKEVYLDNDDIYFYAFLRVQPSLPERFRQKDTTGNIGYFYLDMDDNSATGSPEVRSIAPYYRQIEAQRQHMPEKAFLGYEFELAIDIGFTVHLRDPKPKPINWVEYQLRELGAEGRFDRAVPDGHARTGEDKKLIVYSEEGLEMAMPLKCLKVAPGQKVRIMFVEDGSFGNKESFSWATYRFRNTAPDK